LDPDPKNKKKAKILRNLKKAEEMKHLFQKLQNLRNVRNNSGITRIEVPVRLEKIRNSAQTGVLSTFPQKFFNDYNNATANISVKLKTVRLPPPHLLTNWDSQAIRTQQRTFSMAPMMHQGYPHQSNYYLHISNNLKDHSSARNAQPSATTNTSRN
jgi:hypothetical protein